MKFTAWQESQVIPGEPEDEAGPVWKPRKNLGEMI